MLSQFPHSSLLLWLSPSPPHIQPQNPSLCWNSGTPTHTQTGGLTLTVPRHQMIHVTPQDLEGIGQMPWDWDSKKTCSSTQCIHIGILRTPGLPQSCPSGHQSSGKMANKTGSTDFPGGIQWLRLRPFHCRGDRFDPGQETKISQVMWPKIIIIILIKDRL